MVHKSTCGGTFKIYGYYLDNSVLLQTGPVIDMAVPSSYNDITQDQSIRDHIGWVWYDRTFFQQPKGAADQRLYLRFEGVHYYCMVVSRLSYYIYIDTHTHTCTYACTHTHIHRHMQAYSAHTTHTHTHT